MAINFFREAPPSAVLDLQISLDFGSNWEDGPVTDFTPINEGMGAHSYDLRALGTGTKGISVSTSNLWFPVNLSDSSITGGGTQVTLFVAYSSTSAFDSAVVTITLSDGDTVVLNVTGQSF